MTSDLNFEWYLNKRRACMNMILTNLIMFYRLILGIIKQNIVTLGNNII